jgi:non-heme chloroperoxidase
MSCGVSGIGPRIGAMTKGKPLRDIHIGDVRLRVQDVGAGPPVVLIAGFGMSHEIWDRQVRVLSVSHRVVCVDQRGHGGSDAPLSGYDVDQLARDLLGVLDELEIESCTLVGWSFGGQVVFRLAALAPNRVAGLILVGSSAVRASRSEAFPFGLPPEKTEQALITAEHERRISSRRETIASGMHADVGSDTLDWLLRISLQMPSWAAVACYHSMLTTDLIADIPEISMPTLIVIGDADPRLKGARWLHGQLASAELVQIADCGHYPMLEAPEQFDAVVCRFAGRQEH